MCIYCITIVSDDFPPLPRREMLNPCLSLMADKGFPHNTLSIFFVYFTLNLDPDAYKAT